MKMLSLVSQRILVLAAATVSLALPQMAALAADPGGGSGEFPYVLQPELGATEFAPGDGIVITSLRGNRKQLEPGGRYLLEGTYTLASVDKAELAWSATSRGPSGSTPVAEEEHLMIDKGTGKFQLKKTLPHDGWLHVSFYVDERSHGGVYFGEKGSEKTVLRKKGWSDFARNSAASSLGQSEVDLGQHAASLSNPANLAILKFLGNPVPVPAELDPRYSPANLSKAFTAVCEKAGVRITRLAVDDSEFPFLLYGLLAGQHAYSDLEKGLRETKGYEYGGSSVGHVDDSSTCFAINIIPYNEYPSGVDYTTCSRRLMIRLQMLSENARQSK